MFVTPLRPNFQAFFHRCVTMIVLQKMIIIWSGEVLWMPQTGFVANEGCTRAQNNPGLNSNQMELN